LRLFASKVNRKIVGGDGALPCCSCPRFAQPNTKLYKRSVESFAPDGCYRTVSLSPRGEPILRALAASCSHALGTLGRSLCSPVLTARVGVHLPFFCDALFRLIGNVARALRLSHGLPWTLVRFGHFFDRRQCGNRLVYNRARAVLRQLAGFRAKART